MRDASRIDGFLTTLGAVWKKNPDLRFGQLCAILQKDFAKQKYNWFFAEENDLEIFLMENYL